MTETAIAAAHAATSRRQRMQATLVASGTDRATYLAAVVILPVAAVTVAFGPDLQKLGEIPLVAAAWFVALWSSYSEPRLTGRGTTAAAGAGTLTGIGILSLLLFWLPGFHLGAIELLAMAVAVFATASVVSARTVRLGSRRRLLPVG